MLWLGLRHTNLLCWHLLQNYLWCYKRFRWHDNNLDGIQSRTDLDRTLIIVVTHKSIQVIALVWQSILVETQYNSDQAISQLEHNDAKASSCIVLLIDKISQAVQATPVLCFAQHWRSKYVTAKFNYEIFGCLAWKFLRSSVDLFSQKKTVVWHRNISRLPAVGTGVVLISEAQW